VWEFACKRRILNTNSVHLCLSTLNWKYDDYDVYIMGFISLRDKSEVHSLLLIITVRFATHDSSN
jgi:hypothetical protein